MGESKTKSTTEDQLTADQQAVRQLVEVVPEPRTKDELAARYAGLRHENLWPEQSEASVKSRIGELVKKGVLKEGDKAPDDEPVIELA
jgi:hypothetical protein